MPQPSVHHAACLAHRVIRLQINMGSPLQKTALIVLAILCRVTTSWAQTRTPTSTLTTGCTDNTWTATNTIDAPTGRIYYSAVWTGSEMIVYGGILSAGYTNTGGRYNPATNSWTPTSTTDAAGPRTIHTAVWTGSEMIVWGGEDVHGISLNTGGRYSPNTDSWVATITNGAPSARYAHTAVWTGSEMIVWGGYTNDPLNGGRYNPVTDSWTAVTTTNAPTARHDYTVVWTGSEMIVWGGDDLHGVPLNTGGRYNPTTDSWTATSITNAAFARERHTAVWTGNEMIVWGGDFLGNVSSTGGRYNPVTDSWTATTTTNAPTGRQQHTAVWTGSNMIVWGGGTDSITLFNTGGRYCAQPQPIIISGTISYCSNPVPDPVPNVILALTGSASGSILSDGSGNYTFSGLTFGGSYTVTPTKAALPPGSTGINTVDVIAVVRYLLHIGPPLTGCRLRAADVNGDNMINIVDVIAIQRFFVVLSTGIANTGKYQFIPANRTYSGIVSDQTGQNYDTLIFGDVAAGFVH